MVFPPGIAGGGASDIYSRMLSERIIFLNSQLDDPTATLITAQLLHLEAEDRDRDINLYITSPGGSTDALLAVYDTMQTVACDVATWCLGYVASTAAVILAAGVAGKRSALPHARIVLQQARGEVGHYRPLAVESQANEIVRQRRLVDEILARHTHRPIEQISADTNRDFIMTAQEAVDYGIVDRIVEPRAVPRLRGVPILPGSGGGP
jgi:ATP-dependent Clp protease protease subunit